MQDIIYGIWGSLREWDLVGGDPEIITQDIITGLMSGDNGLLTR